MLLNQTLDKLDALGLFGMALGLREQLESTQYANLSFEERLGVLVDREAEARDSRRLALRLRAAKLRQEAMVEDIDFRTPRGLARSVTMKPGSGRLGDRQAQHFDHRPDGRREKLLSLRLDPRGRAPRAYRALRAHSTPADGTGAQPRRWTVRPPTGGSG